LLVTAALLVARTPLRALQPPGSAFPEALLGIATSAARGCTSIPCLEACAALLCEVAGSAEAPAGGAALGAAVVMLGNRYPRVSQQQRLGAGAMPPWALCSQAGPAGSSGGGGGGSRAALSGRVRSEPLATHCALQVRRTVAERLYTLLLLIDHDAVEGDPEEAMELLASTAWDGPLASVRPARAKLASFLGLRPPAEAAHGGGGAAAEAKAGGSDENASYAALIDHVSRFL
jgi:hypothetical protein